ncbi:MAG: hypothetical protein GY795_26660 [Desulfobacterales bacterium]|nr:hypothetical protein [Desulfobacterales bacterium]
MFTMISDLEDLYDKTVFADANAIIYHLQGMSAVSGEIFRLGRLKKLKLVSILFEE